MKDCKLKVEIDETDEISDAFITINEEAKVRYNKIYGVYAGGSKIDMFIGKWVEQYIDHFPEKYANELKPYLEE